MLKVIVAVVAIGLLPALAFAKETTTLFKVSGWHCEGCTASTEQALRKVEGVKSVKTNLAEGTAEVTYDDDKVTASQLGKIVEQAGYKLVK